MVCSLITNEERKVKEKSFIKKGKIFKYCQGGGHTALVFKAHTQT